MSEVDTIVYFNEKGKANTTKALKLAYEYAEEYDLESERGHYVVIPPDAERRESYAIRYGSRHQHCCCQVREQRCVAMDCKKRDGVCAHSVECRMGQRDEPLVPGPAVERLAADAPLRLETYAREMELVEILDGIFKVSRRIARSQLSPAALNADQLAAAD